MSVESWKVLLHDVFTATEEDFKVYYPLFPEQQAELKKRLRFIQHSITGNNSSEASSSSGGGMGRQKAETELKTNPLWNGIVETPISYYSNRDELFERQPFTNKTSEMWNMVTDHFTAIGRHRSSPGSFQGQMGPPEGHLTRLLLTPVMSEPGSEAFCSGIKDTEEQDRNVFQEDRNVFQEGMICDSENFSCRTEDDERYLRFISAA